MDDQEYEVYEELGWTEILAVFFAFVIATIILFQVIL